MVEISKTNQNKDMIIDGEYSFRIKRRNKNSVIWVCSKETCPAMGSTSVNYLNNLSSWCVLVHHTHQSSEDAIIRKKLLIKMKALMATGIISPRDAINNIMAGALEDKVRALGNKEAVLRILRRHAKNVLNPKPYEYSEMGLSALLSETLLETPFYQYGQGNFRVLEHCDDAVCF